MLTYLQDIVEDKCLQRWRDIPHIMVETLEMTLMDYSCNSDLPLWEDGQGVVGIVVKKTIES